MVGVPKRPEIKVAEFAKALDTDPVADIPFDPAIFGTAANNGQMIAETNANCRAAEMFLSIAQVVTGKAEVRRPKRKSWSRSSPSSSARRLEPRKAGRPSWAKRARGLDREGLGQDGMGQYGVSMESDVE